ncbi:MAG: ethanolamine ammonia-lyase reactivating factor EutA [Rhodospirillaceae bacterium]|nr:ethanolamine ammonia-lyase reactivating factor EutA [Rhodospirillaceae bacterium]
MDKHHAHYHPDPDHTPDGHHPGPAFEGPLEDHSLWQRDNVILSSVCIDIGSAGTQILFSRLHLRRQAVDLSSRYLVVDRETLFESPISLTPYRSERLIDDRALGRLIDDAYLTARLHPDAIDTGVVILTGEALRRDNAERITRLLAETCGELVCASAGHHMEALLAAYGSGAAQASYERGERLLNVDVGGGTTKLSIIDRGQVLSTAAFHVGGRLVAVDGERRIRRLDPAGATHARRAGLNWRVGDRVGAADLAAVAASMVDDLVAVLTDPAPSPDVAALYLTEPIAPLERIDGVVFSGGVAEFVYRREQRDFGDLGGLLGADLRTRIDTGVLPWPLLPDSQGIRSTALGGSEFTAQLSGNTGYISDPEALLPRRNIQVVRPEFEFTDHFDAARLAEAIERRLALFGAAEAPGDVVLAFHWQGSPESRRIKALADGIRRAAAGRIAGGRPIYVILDADIGLNLGATLREALGAGHDVLALDGLSLWDFDYVDLGRMRRPSRTVPVTIKSLVFKDAAGGAPRAQRIHDRPGAAPAPGPSAS